MSYKQKINFEKRISEKLQHLGFQKISIWSLIRLRFLNEYFENAVQRGSFNINEERQEKAAGRTSEWLILAQFVWGLCIKRYSTFIFVNSFSIVPSPSKNFVFLNQNLQSIYENNRGNTAIFINNLDKWGVKGGIKGAYIIPKIPPFLISLFLQYFHNSAIEFLSSQISAELKFSRSYIHAAIRKRISYVYFWKFIFSIAGPSRVIFECPHNSLESEVIAAKLCKIETTEIYHGIINLNEPSYYQNHLDFRGLCHSVCDEYLTPSLLDKRYLKSINNKYSRIKIIKNISDFKSALIGHRLILQKNAIKKRFRKIVFVLTIADNDVGDIKNYIFQNYLVGRKNKIIIRLHPNDDFQRWAKLFRRFLFLRLSNNDLYYDIKSADLLVVQSQTVALELISAGISFENISRNALNSNLDRSRRRGIC